MPYATSASAPTVTTETTRFKSIDHTSIVTTTSTSSKSIDQTSIIATTSTSSFATLTVSPFMSTTHDHDDSSSSYGVKVATITTTTSLNSPTAPSTVSDDNNSFSVGVIVAIVVVAVIFIFITVVMVVSIVVWKKKTKEHAKPEGVYYSAINETSLSRPSTSKPEPVDSEMDDDKQPRYIDISDKVHLTKQPDKITAQENPAAYFAASEQQVELEDNNTTHCDLSPEQHAKL